MTISSGFDPVEHLGRLLADAGLSTASAGGEVTFTGSDPIVASRLRLGACIGIPVMGGAVAAAALWKQRTGQGQGLTLDLRQAIHGITPNAFWNPTLNGEPPPAPLVADNPFLLDSYQTRDGRTVMASGVYPHQVVTWCRFLDVRHVVSHARPRRPVRGGRHPGALPGRPGALRRAKPSRPGAHARPAGRVLAHRAALAGSSADPAGLERASPGRLTVLVRRPGRPAGIGRPGALYTASRMLFTQAREGNVPHRLARTNPRRKVPTAAIAITATCTFIGAVLAYFFPSSAYVFIASLSTFGFLFAWLMIAMSQRCTG
jgi:Amino acid permease